MTENLTPRKIFFNRLKKHKLAVISAFLLILIYFAALLTPLIAPYKIDQMDFTAIGQPPSLKHPMGTDNLGRDVMTRAMYGGRISLAVGLSVAILSALIGTFIGAISGYYGGWMDNILMRFTDLVLTIPALPLLMVVGAFLGGGKVIYIILILGLLLWMYVARVIRASFLSLKEKEFVEAARAIGANDFRIILRHILPNATGPIIVNVTLTVGLAIIMESILSFLGFGIQPPTPSWGNMLTDARSTMTTQPWLTWFPGLMIVVTLLAVNFLGDGLRDALDPKSMEGK